jgi:hypothetical protein
MTGSIARKSKRPLAKSTAARAQASSANSTRDHQKTQPDIDAIFDSCRQAHDAVAALKAQDAPGTKLQAAATRLGFTWTAFGATTRPSFARDEGGEWVRKCQCGGEAVLSQDKDGDVRVGEWNAGPSCTAIEEIQRCLCDEGFQPHHIDYHPIHITMFNDAAARTKRSGEKTLAQISDMIAQTTAETKAQLHWIKLARFGKIRSERGSLRHNANVETISGIELDYDRAEMSFDDALAKLKRLGCRVLIYASPSNTKQKPRWRILFPTSRELNPKMRRVLATRVDRWFGGIFDPASLVLSQAFYFGRALDNPDPDHRVAWGGGTFIDLHPDLEIQDTPKSKTQAYDPAIIAMMRADAGKGTSTDPADCFPDDADIELKIRVALSVIPSDDYEVWFRVGAAIYAAVGDAGFDLFEEWSRESSKYEPRECARKWREFAKISSIRVETIFWYADQHDPGWRTLYRQLLSGEVAA